MATTKELEQKMSSLATSETVEGLEGRVRKLEELCEYEKFRNKVIKIVNETAKTIEFENHINSATNKLMRSDAVVQLCQNYAGREIDRRKLKTNDKRSTAFLAGGVSLAVTLIGALIQHYWK